MTAPAKLPAAPVSISDATALATTGLTPRQWRAALRTLGVPHAKVGRRTVCSAAAWVEAIARASGVATDSAPAPWDEDEAVRRIARGPR